ncbi:MAG: alpha/beta fold hydrolase [Burkholderiales bacterium]
MPSASIIQTRGINLDIIDQGSGQPVVFLHPGEGLDRCGPFLEGLGALGRLIAPYHPGFGRTELPLEFKTVNDLAYFYLDLFDQLDLQDTLLIGAELGGWIAAEIAVRNTRHLSRLVLIDTVGARFAKDETEVEIEDIFTMLPAEVEGRSYREPAKWKRDHAALSDDALQIIARNRESFCLFGWAPYMHNPALRRWLHRIDRPTLVLWGEHDGLVSAHYGRAFAAAIPGALFATIKEAAHFPHIEQPHDTLAAIRTFVAKQQRRGA